MKIIFMGTPDFAVPALERIVDCKNHQVVAVFTNKPKARNRGLKEYPSPVHSAALKYNIEVHTPVSLKKPAIEELIDSIDADIIVIVAYGFIIPKNILQAKKFGCLNIHPSLLPKYRGAAPLQRTIINGEKESAVCIMQMDEGLDTGDIILQEKFILPERVTLSYLHDKCAHLGAELLIKTLDQIEVLPRIPQTNENVIYAHKLSKEEAKINWQESAYQIDCKIRGMNPWPGTYFEYEGNIIKIIEAEYNNISHKHRPGTVINDRLEVACGEGVLSIKKLQLAGRNIMLVEEFIKGMKILEGALFK